MALNASGWDTAQSTCEYKLSFGLSCEDAQDKDDWR